MGSQHKAGLSLSLPHPIISGSTNAPCFPGVGLTHGHTHTHMYIYVHTAQSISPGPTLQLRDKCCGVSAGFCAKLCSLSAVCRTALWRNASPSTTRRRGKREAEEGLRVLRIILKYDHKDPQLPNQSRVEKQKEEVGTFCWGVKRTEHNFRSSHLCLINHLFVQSSCNLST